MLSKLELPGIQKKVLQRGWLGGFMKLFYPGVSLHRSYFFVSMPTLGSYKSVKNYQNQKIELVTYHLSQVLNSIQIFSQIGDIKIFDHFTLTTPKITWELHTLHRHRGIGWNFDWKFFMIKLDDWQKKLDQNIIFKNISLYILTGILTAA